MGASAAALGEYLFGSEAAIGASSATVAEGATATGATNAALAESAVATTATAGGGTAATAGYGATTGVLGSGTAGGSLLKTAATTAVTAGVQKAFAPSAPKVAPPTAMPDPLAQAEAQRQKIAEISSRRGRASTILTDPGAASGALGG